MTEDIEIFKKEKGIKYCSQCDNCGWDYEAGEGPAEADWFVKGYLHHWSGKKVPYRAYLCDAHSTDGNLHDEFDPVFKTMKPITLYAWEQELKELESNENNAHPRQIELAKKKITALGGNYYYPVCDWEYWGKKDRNGNKVYFTSYFPIYDKDENGKEHLWHTATMREDACKYTWLELEDMFPNGYMKEFGTGVTKTFKQIVDEIIPSIKRGRISSKEWADVKKFTLVDPLNVSETIRYNLEDEHGYFMDDDGNGFRVPRFSKEYYIKENPPSLFNWESIFYIKDMNMEKIFDKNNTI